SVLLGLRLPRRVYVAYRNAHAIAFVLPLTAREGYGGDIDLLVGIDTNGRIISVRAIAQRETRGLGDAIDADKSRWIEQFRGQAFDANNSSAWQLRSEGGAFDQITGATVTSRAVIKSVRQALEYFAAHRRELLSEPANE
ncbi:MAG TPA: RnfABCDGE type electron transport complex subunit G, partial [Spongiibacteraceae bacterium]